MAESFDFELVKKLASAFHISSGLDCMVSGEQGEVLWFSANKQRRCDLCDLMGISPPACGDCHTFGLKEAERFGGLYIYACPVGLAHFTVAVFLKTEVVAQVTAGPFLMVNKEEYIHVELARYCGKDRSRRKNAAEYVEGLPFVAAKKVNALSTLLFMSVGFLNDITADDGLLKAQQSNKMLMKIGNVVLQLNKQEDHNYPHQTEKKMLVAITQGDRRGHIQEMLHVILGNLVLRTGADTLQMKLYLAELLTLFSRSAIDGGADPQEAMKLALFHQKSVQDIQRVEELCHFISDALDQFLDLTLRLKDVNNVNVMQKALNYLLERFASKVTLEEVAEWVHLSPSYFGKLFKKETGKSFNSYLNQLRVEKSKELLRENEHTLLEVAILVGFNDPSYFSKVFKQQLGISPKKYRLAYGQNQPNTRSETLNSMLPTNRHMV